MGLWGFVFRTDRDSQLARSQPNPPQMDPVRQNPERATSTLVLKDDPRTESSPTQARNFAFPRSFVYGLPADCKWGTRGTRPLGKWSGGYLVWKLFYVSGIVSGSLDSPLKKEKHRRSIQTPTFSLINLVEKRISTPWPLLTELSFRESDDGLGRSVCCMIAFPQRPEF